MRLGLRAQLLIVSSLLLAIPFLGLRSAREIEAFLVETQEQGLASTARAVATTLHERPAIFVSEDPGTKTASSQGNVAPTLRIEALSQRIVLDGADTDWTGQNSDLHEVIASSQPAVLGGNAPIPTSGSASSVPLRLRYRLGRFERSVFVMVDVR